jgi:hypothetical protein
VGGGRGAPLAQKRVPTRLALPHEIDALVAIDDDAATLYAEHGLALELAEDDPFALAEAQTPVGSVRYASITTPLSYTFELVS